MGSNDSCRATSGASGAPSASPKWGRLGHTGAAMNTLGFVCARRRVGRLRRVAGVVLAALALRGESGSGQAMKATEVQVTRQRRGHLLTNAGVWSPDSQWIVYDTRSDAAGAVFDGETIEMVHVRTGEVKELYRARNGARCGVVTHHPNRQQVVFILGPEHPTADWSYGPYHRQGLLVDYALAAPSAGPQPSAAGSNQPHTSAPMTPQGLDARDLVPPFTPGALRGGSHVHVFSDDGQWVSFTYEDHLLAQFPQPGPDHDLNLRGVGVSGPGGPVRVSRKHPRNHDGAAFTVLVTQTTAVPTPGTDEIKKAFEDAWIGSRGYLRADGTRQVRALAFQGHVVTAAGQTVSELFVVDLPDDLTISGDGPLCGTATRAPFPPRGCRQRRLTHTTDRPFPGLQGPRHWPRSSPDGSRIAFLMKDGEGRVQLWTISPNGGQPVQLTHNRWDIASAFTWSSDGHWIAHAMDNSVFVTDTTTGASTRLTPRSEDAAAPRAEACVFSPDGRQIAFVRHLPAGDGARNQVCAVSID